MTKIGFPLDGVDHESIAKTFGLNKEQQQFLSKLPDRRVAVAKTRKIRKPFPHRKSRSLHDIPSTDEVHEMMKDFYDEILPKEPVIVEVIEPAEVIEQSENNEPSEYRKA